MTPVKLNMSLVKDVIYIVSILVAVIFYFRDKARGEAILETKVDTVIENQRSLLEKAKEIDIKWEKQAEINGKILLYIDLDSDR